MEVNHGASLDPHRRPRLGDGGWDWQAAGMSTRREAEVDRALAALWEEAFDLDRKLGWKLDALHQALEERRGRDPRTWENLPWPTTADEAISEAKVLAATAPDRYPDTGYDPAIWKAIACRKALGEVRDALASVRANEAAQQPLKDEYDEHRWSRFFLVTNVNGHIHRNMACSTTFPTTRWAWLPDLSGLTEADAVAAEGTRLCSICFPSAPVEWTVGLPPKVDPDRCPGSGQEPRMVERQVPRRNPRTGEAYTVTRTDIYCAVCGRDANMTRTGVRAHKAKKA